MPVSSSAEEKEPVLVDAVQSYEDPHPYLKAAREKGAVGVNDLGVYIVFKHKYMDMLLDNSNTRQFELEGMMLRGITSGPLYDFYDKVMLFSNGDIHKRRRMPMVRTFAYKLMDGVRPRVREIAAEIIEAHKGKGEVNFLDAFSRALPARIIAEIIGAPPEDWPQFTKWVAAAARGIGFFQNEELPEIDAGVAALVDYVDKLLKERGQSPREDFLTSYAQATATAGDLSEAEVRAQMAGVILAGSDTTRTGTASILSQLLQHPDQWAMVVADPDRWKKPAVEEGLRYDPPVGSVPRFSLREMEIEGVTIPEGRVVSMSVLSGLRDPEVYPDPERFDITRENLPRWNIAFGGGAHRCLGEALARAEMEESIATIARLAPNTRIIGKPPTIKGSAAIRHIDAMTVEFA
ncbi:MAG: cytochrome P450 [Parvularculaceae bacterium]